MDRFNGVTFTVRCGLLFDLFLFLFLFFNDARLSHVLILILARNVTMLVAVLMRRRSASSVIRRMNIADVAFTPSVIAVAWKWAWISVLDAIRSVACNVRRCSLTGDTGRSGISASMWCSELSCIVACCRWFGVDHCVHSFLSEHKIAKRNKGLIVQRLALFAELKLPSFGKSTAGCLQKLIFCEKVVAL